MGKVARKLKRFEYLYDIKKRGGRLIMAAIIATALYVMLAPKAQAFDREKWLAAKWSHQPSFMNNENLKIISSKNDVNYMWSKYLKPILVERIVGTENHRLVREHIIHSLEELNANWHIETDVFTEEAPQPYGEVEFTSVIATLNPHAPRKLVLACHYESKIMAEGKFYAATDSAVPCAMMLNVANVLDDLLAKHDSEVTLQLVFLDGEEAFINWNDKDSIYGARNLAQKWQSQPYPDDTSPNNVLDSIDLFVLLDLLGAKNPKFESHFTKTSNNHQHMQSVEKRLHKEGLLEAHNTANQYFVSTTRYAGRISDDHIPFLRRGVRILHWISTPFPSTWHTLDDNEENLHRPTIANLNKIISIFVSEYLDLH